MCQSRQPGKWLIIKAEIPSYRTPERLTVTSTTPRGGAVAGRELQRDRLTS